ncbi:related to integral membrane protein PTH11 [Cephalotrichum gorgonifer]|uniref:Related to integral membrane protein PTH11 n=1 Tax=Cephalotrichum gorgonifer TaxID=2041049 RepID=A0AAE8N505_9PEZI|nr:related to integral membrane protein PTH11 [Cephalotrichum gorgonifer]
MRLWLPSSLALLALGLFPVAEAQSLSDAIATLPDCALTCLETALIESSCAPTDQACICRDTVLLGDVSICVKASCTVKEQLSTKNTTSTSCNAPIRDKSKSLNTLTAVFGAITAVIVFARLLFKYWTDLGWTPDDWTVLVTMFVGIPNTILSIHGVGSNGLGQDVWTLPFEKITRFGYFFYIIEVFYFLEVPLLKLSILLFYLRIFPGRKERTILWATVILNALFGIAFIFAGIFQCTPVSYYWTKWDGEHQGKCVSINGIAWANAIVSIVFDIWMLVIPMSQLHKLQLHWKRKVGVGLIVTIISILRLQSLVTFGKSHDNPTWDNSGVSKWSVIEINVGLICACMPTIRLALAKAFTVFRETTVGRSYAGANHHTTSASRRRGNASRVVATNNASRPGSISGVECRKSFQVEYGPADDSSIIPMNDFDEDHRGAGRSGRDSPRSGSERSLRQG